MRRLHHILLLAVLAGILSGCENDMLYWSLPENYTAPKYFSGSDWSETFSDNIYEVSLEANLSGGSAAVNIGYAELQVGSDESMSVIVARAGATATASHFSGKVKFSRGGLPAYYVRAVIGSGSDRDLVYSEIYTVRPSYVPTLTTEVTEPSWYTVSVASTIDNHGYPIQEKGILFSCTNSNLTYDNYDYRDAVSGGTTSFKMRISVMDAAKDAGLDYRNSPTYYIRTYARTAGGIGYGPVAHCKTLAWPTCNIQGVSNITSTSATFNYTINKASGDNSTITEYVYYSKTDLFKGSTRIGGHTMTGLSPSTTYYCWAYIENTYGDNIYWTDSQSFTTLSGVSFQAVDLGLPSGVKWANMNLGATKPEDYGDYYAWGETLPKSNYSWETYAFRSSGTGDEDVKFSKYNTKSERGPVDNKVELELSDDAAHVNWGGNWRLPTKDDWSELMDNCTWTWVTQNGVNGFRVRGSSAEIFLPAADMRLLDWEPSNNQDKGEYWSSSFYGDDPLGVWCLSITPSGKASVGGYRCYGRSIRPVCD